MKKHVCILFVLLMLGLCGCGKKQEYAESSPDIADSFPLQAEPAENPQIAKSDGPYAILHTTAGDIKILLYPEQAPKAVENFIGLAKEGYYDGTLFFYAKKDELTQTGNPGPNVKPQEGQEVAEEKSIWGEAFANEYSDDLHHFPGAVGMAGKGANLSQFYLQVSKAKAQDEQVIPANMYMNELINMRMAELNEEAIAEAKTHSDEELAAFEEDLNAEIQRIATDGVPEEFLRKYEPVLETYRRTGGSWSLDYQYTIFGQIVEGLNVAEAITQVKVEAASRKPKKDVVIESIEIVE